MERVKVRDVMTETVVSVRPGTTVREAADLMLFHNISGLPVVDRDGKVVGMITEGDLLEKEAATAPTDGHQRRRASAEDFERTVEQVMTTDVVCAEGGEDLRKAARRMLKRKVKRLPVVDYDVLVGILSRHDVLEVFLRTDLELQQAIRGFLAECGFGKPGADIKVHVADGVVALTGHVFFESDGRVVGALTASVDGVVGVDNQLTFRHPDPRMTTVGYHYFG